MLQFKPNGRSLAQFFKEIHQNAGKHVNGPSSAVLRDCLVSLITSKRIELQTWDWSSFIDIFENNTRKINIDSTTAERVVDTSSKCSKDQE